MVRSFAWKKLTKSMKRPGCGANCDGPKKLWPMPTWSWSWSKRFWRWPASRWTRRWRALKKSTLAGRAPGGPNAPRIDRGRALRIGSDDYPKLLCAPERAQPARGGCGSGADPGAGGARAAAALGSAKALSHYCARAQSRRREAGAGPALCRTGQGGLAGGEKALGMAQNHPGEPEPAGVQEPD